MSRYRRAARVDDHQAQLVKHLRCIPGVTVITGHDDILVGHRGRTYWYEIKSPRAISKRTGMPLEGAIEPSQAALLAGWRGHYRVVSTLEEILGDLHGTSMGGER